MVVISNCQQLGVYTCLTFKEPSIGNPGFGLTEFIYGLMGVIRENAHRVLICAVILGAQRYPS